MNVFILLSGFIKIDFESLFLVMSFQKLKNSQSNTSVKIISMVKRKYNVVNRSVRETLSKRYNIYSI